MWHSMAGWWDWRVPWLGLPGSHSADKCGLLRVSGRKWGGERERGVTPGHGVATLSVPSFHALDLSPDWLVA